MTSPVCTVNGLSTSGGVNVTASSTPTIALANSAGVTSWSIACIGTDETNTASAVNASIVVTSFLSTFSAPDLGSSLIFKSVVNQGLDANGRPDPTLSTTFKVAVLTASGYRVVATNETVENDPTFGWTTVLNTAVRAAGVAGGLPSGSTGALLYHNASAWIPLNIGSSGQNLTVSGGNPVWATASTVATDLSISSQTTGDILYYNGSHWVRLAIGSGSQILGISGGLPAWVNDTEALPTDLNIASEAQGDILYYNGANWVRLAAGSNGNFLKTQGAGANPVWAASGGGTPSGSAGGILTGSYPNPTDIRFSGQIQGSVPYFNGSNWAQLAPGVSDFGKVLFTQGSGSNPAWAFVNLALATYSGTAAGDLVYISSSSAPHTVNNLAIGTSGQVLTVAGGQPTWATPSGGGGGFSYTDHAGGPEQGDLLYYSGSAWTALDPPDALGDGSGYYLALTGPAANPTWNLTSTVAGNGAVAGYLQTSGDATQTTNTYANLGSTTTITVTDATRKYVIALTGSFHKTNANGTLHLLVNLDGTVAGGSTSGGSTVFETSVSATNGFTVVACANYVTTFTVGTHVLNLDWKVDTNGITITNANGEFASIVVR